MDIKIIYAVSENGVIGQNNQIPWNIPDELTHFKEITANGILIMGRKTYDSLPANKLPGRVLIVVSGKNADAINCSTTNCDIIAVRSFGEALATVKLLNCITSRCVFVVGGAELIKAAINIAVGLVVSVIHFIVNDHPTNITVNPVDLSTWELVRSNKRVDRLSGVEFDINHYVKRI